MQLVELVQRVDALKAEIDALRPINYEQEQRVLQKFRLEWNYHSNALEGNTLTLGETRAFLLHGITAQGKPFRDYEDIKGHQEAIEYLEQFVQQKEFLTEAYIRELHRVLLIEPYEMAAVTLEGLPTKRRIAIGRYKTASNSVRTSTGEVHYYATPEATPALMGDLMKWYHSEVAQPTLPPFIFAATFHLRFVNIHPFDDGNGRMARLLMNLILMQAGYVPVIIQTNSKAEYLLALEKADVGEIEDFIELIGKNLLRSLELFLHGAKGEPIDELSDLDRQIVSLRKQWEVKGKVSAKPKDLAGQKIIFNHLIQPFLTKLYDRMIQFAPLFATTSHTISINPGMHQQQLKDERYKEQLLELSRIIEAQQELDSLVVEHTLRDFLRDTQYGVRLQVSFNFEPYQVAIEYAIDDPRNRVSYKNATLTNTGYQKVYMSQEIDELIYTVVKEIYNRVEQMAESANASNLDHP